MNRNFNANYRDAEFGHRGRGRGMHSHGGPMKGGRMHGGPRRGPGQRRNHQQLEAALLVLLAENASYGYQLMESLKEFYAEPFNSSILYRKLMRMEEMGLVASSVDEVDSKGPARRMYEITDGGKTAMNEWVDYLKLRQEQITKLLERAEKVL